MPAITHLTGTLVITVQGGVGFHGLLVSRGDQSRVFGAGGGTSVILTRGDVLLADLFILRSLLNILMLL